MHVVPKFPGAAEQARARPSRVNMNREVCVMNECEGCQQSRLLLEQATRVLDDILREDDDFVLSSELLTEGDDDDMKLLKHQATDEALKVTLEPKILQAERQKEEALSNQLRRLLSERSRAKAEADAEGRNEALAWAQIMPKDQFALERAAPPMSTDLRLYLKSRGELPPDPQPALSLRNRFFMINDDTVDCDYQLQRQRLRVAQLAKEWNHVRALLGLDD